MKTMPDLHGARDRIDFVNFDTWGKVESAPVDFLKTPDGRYFDRPVDSATGSQVAAVIFWIYWFGGTKELAELKACCIGGTPVNQDNTEGTPEFGDAVETAREPLSLIAKIQSDLQGNLQRSAEMTDPTKWN